jgi:hypothetical protein
MAKSNTDHRAFPTFCKRSTGEFLGRLAGQVQQSAKKFFELLSERQRDLYMVSPRYARPEQRRCVRRASSI